MHWDPMISSIKNKSIIVTYNVLSTITLLLTLPFRKSQLLFTEYCDFLSYEKPWCFQFQGFDSVPIQMIKKNISLDLRKGSKYQLDEDFEAVIQWGIDSGVETASLNIADVWQVWVLVTLVLVTVTAWVCWHWAIRRCAHSHETHIF